MYAELKCKSNFSFLRGASHPETLMQQAISLKLPALAITDLNGVYGLPKAYAVIKQNPSTKLICGAELTFHEHPNITILARNRKSYGLLCRMITRSHADKPKGEAVLTLEELVQFAEEPASQDLWFLPDEGSNYALLKELFPQKVLLPLGRFKDGHDRARTERARQMEKKYDLPIVATNDVHYHSRSCQRLQDVLTCIREGETLDRIGYKIFPNSERCLKSPQAMMRLFADLPQAVSKTLEVAESCTFSMSELRYRYPSEWIPKNHTAQSYLEECTYRGARERYKGLIPESVENQIRHELRLIEQLGFADYFLTIYDIVEFAKSKKILCQGRGSAANSVVCYCLGITAIDPVQMNLLFERFISAERNEPPDIDVDFEHERREEVIRYIYDKYGRDRAAMVSAVVTYKDRSALREIAKALGIEVGTLSAKKLKQQIENNPSAYPRANHMDRLLEEIERFPRHLSIHSGGFTLSADPIIEIVPVEPARMEGRTIIQWDKYDLETLGLLKVDVLSLGMLTALRKVLDQVGMKLYEIPHDDKPTYEMIQKADTVGTFQIESRAQMSMLGRLQPKCFYDLVIEVAIVRPGPTVGNMVHPYLKRRQGREKIEYYHPKLEKILGKTLGVPLFQEQVMQMAIELGGFTPGEADELRRAIGAWRSHGSVMKMGKRLIDGLMKSGLPQEFAERVFQQIQGFAEYGFPESHAASFALLAYASCYLKCHYPAEFTAALINSQPMGFYANHTLIDDAKRHGVNVLPVHPNFSDWDCTVVKSDSVKDSDTSRSTSLRLGWRVVKGLSQSVAEEIIAHRPYESLDEFLAKTHVPRRILEKMALGNVFACFGLDQRHTLWRILSYQTSKTPDLLSGLPLEAVQQTLFSGFDMYTAIREDYETFHLSTQGHPMEALRKIKRLPALTSKMAKACKPGQLIESSGLILLRQKPPTAKGVAFTTLEDEFGFLDLILHPKIFDKYRSVYLNECFVIVEGTLQKDGHTASVLVRSMRPIWESTEPTQEQMNIEPDQYFW